MLQNGLVSGLAWASGVGLGGSCALGSSCSVTHTLSVTATLPSSASRGKQGPRTLGGTSEFALLPVNGGSWLRLVLGRPQRDKVRRLFSLAVVFLLCKPRAEEGAGSCFPLVF